MTAGFEKSTFENDALIAGGADIHGEKVTIPDGTAAMARGTVLGKITASGKCIPSLAAAVDGSEVPYAILGQDTAALAGADGEAIAYLSGDFLTSELTIGAGHTADSIKEGLREKGIWLV